jgi:cell division protein FtsQ
MNAVAALLLLLAAGLLALAAVRWVAQRPAFELRRIELRGDLQHVTAASVRGAIAGRLKGNYFTMRLDDTRRLLETVPWVAQASVRRVWPDRLLITLSEHRALGAWADGRLLSDRGELFVANVAEAEVFGPLPSSTDRRRGAPDGPPVL